MQRRDFLRSAALSVSYLASGRALAGSDVERAEAQSPPDANRELRIGMIGCDTSHCGAFTKLLSAEDRPTERSGARVVACYPSFSPDIEGSVGRVDKFKKQLQDDFGVKMVGAIGDMIDQVDAVLLESVDGRRHLSELRQIAKSGKPVFVDKPFSASLADAKEMVALIKRNDLPCFSCSSLRFDSAFVNFLSDEASRGKIIGCDAFGPAHLNATNPGWFWYGIHGVEILYSIMGRGCQSVRCMSQEGADFAVGTWKDGRIGTMRGSREGAKKYGATVSCGKAVVHLTSAGDYYANLVNQIVAFFRTRKPPVAIEDTLEICAFIDAAWRSSQQGGKEVKLDL